MTRPPDPRSTALRAQIRGPVAPDPYWNAIATGFDARTPVGATKP